jgi:hypothetical protein
MTNRHATRYSRRKIGNTRSHIPEKASERDINFQALVDWQMNAITFGKNVFADDLRASGI